MEESNGLTIPVEDILVICYGGMDSNSNPLWAAEIVLPVWYQSSEFKKSWHNLMLTSHLERGPAEFVELKI